MDFRLFERRTVWWPTWKAWLLVFALFVAPFLLWAAYAEPFLARTERLPAEVLVVESWLQEDGLHAAATEFKTGGYRLLIITGGLTGSKGTLRRRPYSDIATRELREAGIDPASFIVAPMEDVDTQRTYTMAVGVRTALERAAIKAAAVNVFTEGVHARRSRLVYAKVLGPTLNVGVVSWQPWKREAPWWKSSERALDLYKETLAYPYELLLDSGRGR